ncbi:multicopper oxidase domain-containing protein, partial [Salmonella enterica]|uniref:multicopper oxidase domain-containing protein n=1 Tax=Salmonella enterica TaxID=28901 RepID=UPI003D76A1CF
MAADGVSRPLLAVNRQLPGPAIQVCEGDRVVVDVYNWQLSDTATIHWHGQHMNNQQYNDGVPYVTQCPILGAFRYDFIAT